MVRKTQAKRRFKDIMNVRSRGYCFTINNETEEDVQLMLSMPCEYLVVGFEEGDKRHTPHIQGYVYFEHQRRFGAIKKKYLPRGHLEVQRGTCERAAGYCMEDGEYFEFGVPPKQGERNDLNAIREDIAKYSLLEVAERNIGPYIRYNRGIKDLYYLVQQHRTEAPYVEWVWGPTGSGKTTYARSKSDSCYLKNCQNQWWDGYDQDAVIILDDFDRSMDFRYLLRLLDRHPFTGEVKGGTIKINSPTIFITCDRSPEQLYSGFKTNEEFAQLKRRISKVTYIGYPGTQEMGPLMCLSRDKNSNGDCGKFSQYVNGEDSDSGYSPVSEE